MYYYKIKTSFLSPKLPKVRAKKTGFSLMIVHCYSSRKLVGRARFSLDLSDHLENPEHYPRVMRCNTLTPKDISLSNIHQTTNPLIVRTLSEKS